MRPSGSSGGFRIQESEVEVCSNDVRLPGILTYPEQARGIVVFAHGSGSSRLSPRNGHVSLMLNDAGFATLLFDLLTTREEQEERLTRHLRFDIEFLTRRLTGAVQWVKESKDTSELRVGLFGASTGAAAALAAASQLPGLVAAVVSRGGRPDLTGDELLAKVKAPTLLIVGSLDKAVIGMNRQAMAKMQAECRLEIVEGATHLFEEPGTLYRVGELAAEWFAQHGLGPAPVRGFA